MSFRYSINGTDISDISTKWLVLMAWGRREIKMKSDIAIQSAICIVNFCVYNFSQFHICCEKYEIDKLQNPGTRIEDIISLEYLRLIILTINRGGSVLLDVYKQEISIAEARLKKSARLTTSALYRLWIDIRQRIEHILKISEDEIISADSESISKLLSQVKYEFKTIDMAMKSKLKCFIEFALKRIHLLDNPLLEEVLRTTPTDIIEQLKSMPISYFGEDVRNNPYWMELGHNKYLHNMVDSMIHAEKSNIIVQNIKRIDTKSL